jgi:hypothetical protein
MEKETAFLVGRRELVEALKTVRKFMKRKRDVEIIFTFNGNVLTIDAGGMTLDLSGEGSLVGQAYVYWGHLLGIAAVPPSEEKLILKIQAGYMIIGTTYLPCTWQESILEVIDFPMEATLEVILALRLKHTDEQIARSGLIETLWGSRAPKGRVGPPGGKAAAAPRCQLRGLGPACHRVTGQEDQRQRKLESNSPNQEMPAVGRKAAETSPGSARF